jgi:hypothetical protein
MRRFIYISIIAATQLLLTKTSLAQVYIEDLNLYPDEYLQKKIHDSPDINQYYPFVNGYGNYPNLNAKPEFPKKIALISFYVWDPQIVIQQKTVEQFWAGSYWIDSIRGNKLASSLISYSLESMQERMDSLGSQLISPSDFTPAQLAAYDSIQIDYLKTYRKKVPENITYDLCSASPFKFIKMPSQKLDYKFANSLADLARILGVDAVLLVENQITYTGNLGLVNNIIMNLYGFNPVAKPTGTNVSTKKKYLYNDFLLYCSVEQEVAAIVSQYDINKELKYENYIGYDRLLDLMIDKIYTCYQERAKITPKKI